MPSNNIPVWNIITNEILPRFINQSPFIITADRRFDKYYKETGYQVGETINIRQRRRSFPVQGRVASPNAIQNPLTPLTISQEWNDSIEYTGKEIALFLEKEAQQFAEREIAPMATGLANNIESFCAQQAVLQINNIIGDPTSNLSSFAAVDDAQRFLLQNGVNLREGAYFATSIIDAHTLRSALNNQFNPILNEEIDIYGSLGNLAGFDMFSSQLITQHINGPLGGTPVVSATSNSGDMVVSVSGFTATTQVLNAGDTIYFEGVYAINPLTYVSTGNLMQFVVTANVTTDGSGNAVIPISPPIISDPSNTTRNVTGAIPITTPLQLYGAPNANFNVNIAYVSEALILAIPPKPPLYIANYGVATDEETGVTLRLGMAGDIFNDVNLVRLDALYGAVWNAPYAVKVASLAS
jgi:hypothetical protein